MTLFEADAGDQAAIRRSAESRLDAMHLAAAWAEAKGFAVFEHAGAHHLAMRDLLDPQVRGVVDRKAAGLGWTLQPVLVTPSQFEALRASGAATANGTEVGSDIKTLRELAEEGPTIELVNGILSKAVTQRASDIHIEPTEFNFTVRTRIDGEMVVQTVQPREKFDAVSSRVKILSNLDIAERRLPQDGRINARVNGESFDIRVSVLPASAGESIVLRLLRQERRPTHLADLGMGEAHARLFEAWSHQSNGIVLVTGPTGSGKSTTLYTALELSNDQSRKIITVEDPVEYKIPGITQLQVNADIGFTFASALRSILRHDPDMILVGEIRDEETARIAIQSSLTGHLVYSTLHTNSALGAVTRLVDMGVEPFLIAASLRGLMAQRLVRRLCPQCAVPDEQPEQALGALAAKWGSGAQLAGQGLRRAVGCAHCSGTGFYGRVAIYDLIDIDTATAEMIAKGLGEEEMARRLRLPSIGGLAASGLQLVAEGVTTVAEVIRATG
ncbi:GspE/PulE family protein [Piscinibacter sakaiensis]|uniref:GspE/PulE family protein n=1 Tax=Piscinibacter sakaiensis TaxID=1547922 RepID=UPI00372C96CC